MRITNNLLTNTTLRDVNKSLEDMAKLNRTLSSAVRINKPSDDPLGTNSVLSFQHSIAKTTQYASNIDTGISFLGLTDNTLGDIGGLVNRAKQLALTHRDSSSTTDLRKGAAIEINNIFNSLMQFANRTEIGRYLFGGTETASNPFERIGDFVRYNGNEEQILIKTATHSESAINISGQSAFGALDARISGKVDLNPAVLVAPGAGEVSTKLSQLNNSNGVSTGTIVMTVGATSYTIDLTNAESLQDIKTMIEAAAPGVTVSANAARNGLTVTTGGPALTIADSSSTIARDLGIVGNAPGGTINGTDIDPLVSRFTRLQDLYIDNPPGYYNPLNAAHNPGFVITNGTKTATISLVGKNTLEDVLNAINTSETDTYATIDANNRINVISKMSGAALKIEENGGQSASMLGILSQVDFTSHLTSLRNGLGVDKSLIHINWSGNPAGKDVDLTTAVTVGDVRNAIQALAPGVLTVSIVNGNALRISDSGGGPLTISDVTGSLATQSGLSGAWGAGPATGVDLDPVVINENVFTSMWRIKKALETDMPEQLDEAMNNLDAALKTLLNARAESGARSKMLNTSQTRLKDESTQLSTLLGSTWDTDFPSTIMQLTTRQNAFQAALQTAAKIIPLSLVDFL